MEYNKLTNYHRLKLNYDPASYYSSLLLANFLKKYNNVLIAYYLIINL
jgi:hypothetical protein